MTGASAPKSELRLDIQALRGFAVLLVVLYHAGIDVLPAGNLGVDVFFVISGFLITSVIAKAIERGDFSFREFYYRRAKRLLPAAYCVILATVALAPFFISDVAFEEMTAQVWGAVTFTANFVLWNQTGYFDGSAATKPFLHFWSLAIEEQYYLVMPLLLVLVPRRAWLPLLSGIVVVSALSCLWLAQTDPDMSFYWPHARAWELAIGSLLAIAPYSKIPLRLRSLARIPAIAILVAAPVFPTGFPHPGIDAMLVTVATAIVIAGMSGHAAERSSPVRALALLGDFSYSLYLVHWPVIVFTRAAWLEQAPAWALYLAIAISVALSLVLYRLVEEPFRKGFGTNRKVLTAGLLATSVMVVASPSAISAATQSDTDYAYLMRRNVGLDRACASAEGPLGALPEKCISNPPPKVLLWGDSYAMMWGEALAKELAPIGLAQATRPACVPMVGVYPSSARASASKKAEDLACMSFHQEAFAYALNSPEIEVVVMSSPFSSAVSPGSVYVGGPDEEEIVSWQRSAEIIEGAARTLRDSGKSLLILAPPPSTTFNAGECAERALSGKFVFRNSAGCAIAEDEWRSVRSRNIAMLEQLEATGVPVAWPSDVLCNQRLCETVSEDTILYRDNGHLTYEGAEVISRRMNIGVWIASQMK